MLCVCVYVFFFFFFFFKVNKSHDYLNFLHVTRIFGVLLRSFVDYSLRVSVVDNLDDSWTEMAVMSLTSRKGTFTQHTQATRNDRSGGGDNMGWNGKGKGPQT